MRRILKSPAAENDLESIWLYSFGEWGEGQADHYYDELVAGMDKLTAMWLIYLPRFLPTNIFISDKLGLIFKDTQEALLFP